MLVYDYIMVGSSACILQYNGGFQCLYNGGLVDSSVCILLYNGGFHVVGSSACILLYNGVFLSFRVLLRSAKKKGLSDDI